MDEKPRPEDIKLAVNNAIWMYAHPDTTMKEAEEIAIECHNLILGTWRKRERA